MIIVGAADAVGQVALFFVSFISFIHHVRDNICFSVSVYASISVPHHTRSCSVLDSIVSFGLIPSLYE